MAIEETLCPECNGSMTPRTSARGKFWGCKAYPRCKGTRNSDGEVPRRRSEDAGCDVDERAPSDRLRENDRRRWDR